MTYRVATTRGADGNDIKLHIYRPAETTGRLPCVVHIHGGGMTILDTDHHVSTGGGTAIWLLPGWSPSPSSSVTPGPLADSTRSRPV